MCNASLGILNRTRGGRTSRARINYLENNSEIGLDNPVTNCYFMPNRNRVPDHMGV
jgi:hypothetical protein